MKRWNLRKGIVSAALGAACLLGSGAASAIIVSGVDFGSPGINHIETTTLAETFVNSPGQTLTAYGVVNTVNGNPNYATTSGYYLYFVATYTVSTWSASAATFDGGTMSVYLNPFVNLLSQSSASNLTTIQGGTLWATLSGHASLPSTHELQATGSLDGAQLSFTGTGLLSMVSGANGVFEYLNANNIADGYGGFADIGMTTSGSNITLNSNDDISSCRTANPTVGAWCFAGSADLRGDSVLVPEPSVLALVGLGLFGIGATVRRRKN